MMPLLHSSNSDSPIPRLQPTDHTIVPVHEMKPGVGDGYANNRFQLHHTQPNTKKVYIKDFAHHLQNMLEDSSYKFSEEYEVSSVK